MSKESDRIKAIKKVTEQRTDLGGREERIHLEENRFALRIASIICSCILGIVALLGVFWGREGIIFLGLAIVFSSIAIIMFAGTTHN